MSNDLSKTRLLHGAGIAASGFLTGYITLFSITDRYALLAAPTTETAEVWQRLYNVGKNTAPVMAVAASGIFGYLAYQAPTKELGQLYTASALLLPMIAPFTIFGMKSTNDALHLAADQGTTDTGRIRDLLDTWWKLNAVRAVITGSATALAVWASARPFVTLTPFK
ncbi:hypothetical protein NCC49_000072 [Naganishia albida]|nr:hypothetical protein NCC49_000072 [Naganishia albida]